MRLNYQQLYQDIQDAIINLLSDDDETSVALGKRFNRIIEEAKAKQQRPVFSDEY